GDGGVIGGSFVLGTGTKLLLQESDTLGDIAGLHLAGNTTGGARIYFGHANSSPLATIAFSNVTGDMTFTIQDALNIDLAEAVTIETTDNDQGFNMFINTTSTTGAQPAFILRRTTTGTPSNNSFGVGFRFEGNSGADFGDVFGQLGTASGDGNLILNVRDGSAAVQVLKAFGGEQVVAIAQGSANFIT